MRSASLADPHAPAGPPPDPGAAPPPPGTLATDRVPSYGEVLAFTAPLVLQLATQAVHTTMDAAFVGRLGTEALAALGMAGIAYGVGLVLLLGLMRNSMAFTARAFGGGSLRQVGQVVGQYQLLALAGLPLLWLIAQAFPWICRWAHLTPHVTHLAAQYLGIRLWDVPLVMTTTLYASFYQATGNSRFPMLVAWSTVPLNALLNYALIFGHGGLPALGISGSALATVLAQGCGMVIMLASTHLGSLRARYGLALLARPQWRLLLRIVAVSLPQGLGDGLEVLAYLGFFAILGQLGQATLAASNIGILVTHLLFMPGLALGIGSASYVGRFLGLGAPALAKASAWRVLSLGVAYMGLLGLPLWFWGQAIAGLFSNDGEVLQQARVIFRVMAVYQVCDATCIILRVTLGGAADTVFPTVALASVAALVLLPGSWLLSHWISPGAVGAWLGAFLYMFILAGILLARFAWGPWQRQGAWPATVTGPAL